MLRDELNKLEAWPEPNKGKVNLEDQDGKPLEVEGEGWLDAHPEGSDRGGYVPYWVRGEERAYYDETGGEWLSG